MERKKPTFLPHFAPHLFPGPQTQRGRRTIYISRSSPLKHQGFPVGTIQVRLEDSEQENEQGVHLPHNGQEIASSANSDIFSVTSTCTSSDPGTFFTALYRQDRERAATAFNSYRLVCPTSAAQLLAVLADGTKEERDLEEFLYRDLRWRDLDAALDLVDRSLRLSLDLAQLPRPTYPSLSVIYLSGLLAVLADETAFSHLAFREGVQLLAVVEGELHTVSSSSYYSCFDMPPS
ncbi:unnamed protein product [Cyclocybe aegerita]|uniref:Uncharacterized protein n=1 Tax=Cyclocybe aegerita TaxID=1973307 RepID=A0A8S0W5K7_CYCAE|nr:unnamed protein product [Cyclocybe aegerita]